MAEVHARQHILVCLGDAHHAIAEDIGIRVRVVLRGDNLRGGVLRVLDERILLDDGEVDVGRAGCLRVTAGFLPGLAGKLLDGRVEAALGNLDDLLEAFQNLLALRGVHIVDALQQRRRDEQVAPGGGDFLIVHGRHGSTQRRNGGRAIGKRLFLLRDAADATVGRKAESVQFGHNLVTDELSGQTAKGKASGFQIVHDVHIKAAATVKVALDRLIRHGDAALHITAVAAVVGQTVHAHHGDDEFVGVRALLGEFGRTVQHARKRGQSVALIQLGDKRFCEFDSVAHRFCSLSYSIGRPIALRRALSELSVVMAVRPVPAA